MANFHLAAMLCLLIKAVTSIQSTSGTATPLPIVLWHGMGDTCCNPLSLESIKRLLEENIPGVNVTSLRIGSTIIEDFESGYLRNVNDQIEFVCKLLQSEKTFQDGYNAIGFSQGGLFFRGLAERCPSPKMVSLISLGGPQQGVFGFPRCPGSAAICDTIRRLLNYGAYSWIQNFVVQAEYWHDPLDEDKYKSKSVFLADINCDKKRNETYRENLVKLKNLVLVMFTRDSMVVPKESEWFGFYSPGQSKDIYNLTDSPLYKEDWIGLKQLNDNGRLHLYAVDGDHLQIDEQWFIDSIIKPYLQIQP